MYALRRTIHNICGKTEKVVIFLQAKLCSDSLMEKLCSHNRRSLDLLSAKAYFYHSRVYELLDQLASIRR